MSARAKTPRSKGTAPTQPLKPAIRLCAFHGWTTDLVRRTVSCDAETCDPIADHANGIAMLGTIQRLALEAVGYLRRDAEFGDMRAQQGRDDAVGVLLAIEVMAGAVGSNYTNPRWRPRLLSSGEEV